MNTRMIATLVPWLATPSMVPTPQVQMSPVFIVAFLFSSRVTSKAPRVHSQIMALSIFEVGITAPGCNVTSTSWTLGTPAIREGVSLMTLGSYPGLCQRATTLAEHERRHTHQPG
jgi:hypothetical protein